MDNLDMSNFDPNAILRGAQLTLVGGGCRLLYSKHGGPNMCLQSTVPSRTQAYSRRTTTAKQPSLWQPASRFESSSPYPYASASPACHSLAEQD
jgi:hypothetical protein